MDHGMVLWSLRMKLRCHRRIHLAAVECGLLSGPQSARLRIQALAERSPGAVRRQERCGAGLPLARPNKGRAITWPRPKTRAGTARIGFGRADATFRDGC